MIIGIVAAAAALLVILLIVLGIQKQQKEKQAQEEREFKNQVLDAALKNPAESRSIVANHGGLKPLEQNSAQGQLSDIRTKMIKLSVSGKEGNTYLVNPEKHIYIGSEPHCNDIVLPDRQICGQQGDIFPHKEKVYIRNLNQAGSLGLRRGSQHTFVLDKAIELNTGDVLELSAYRIQITIMDYIGNTIYS